MADMDLKKIKTGLILVLVFVVFLFIRADVFEEKVYEVEMTEQVQQDLLNQYYLADVNEIEVGVCLRGTIEDGVAYVDSYYFPRQSASRTSLEYSVCNGLNVIGFMHTHPGQDCLLSPTDVFAFGESGLSFVGLICNDGQFVFINSDLNYLT